MPRSNHWPVTERGTTAAKILATQTLSCAGAGLDRYGQANIRAQSVMAFLRTCSDPILPCFLLSPSQGRSKNDGLCDSLSSLAVDLSGEVVTVHIRISRAAYLALELVIQSMHLRWYKLHDMKDAH
jgi:hypothetical protein